jgi:hypothetical protein
VVFCGVFVCVGVCVECVCVRCVHMVVCACVLFVCVLCFVVRVHACGARASVWFLWCVCLCACVWCFVVCGVCVWCVRVVRACAWCVGGVCVRVVCGVVWCSVCLFEDEGAPCRKRHAADALQHAVADRLNRLAADRYYMGISKLVSCYGKCLNV